MAQIPIGGYLCVKLSGLIDIRLEPKKVQSNECVGNSKHAVRFSIFATVQHKNMIMINLLTSMKQTEARGLEEEELEVRRKLEWRIWREGAHGERGERGGTREGAG